MIRVRWPDGGVMTAWNWHMLLDRARRTQWSAHGDRQFRAQMAQRARIWAATNVRTQGTIQEFFLDLEKAGMVRILDGKKQQPPPPLRLPNVGYANVPKLT